MGVNVIFTTFSQSLNSKLATQQFNRWSKRNFASIRVFWCIPYFKFKADVYLKNRKDLNLLQMKYVYHMIFGFMNTITLSCFSRFPWNICIQATICVLATGHLIIYMFKSCFMRIPIYIYIDKEFVRVKSSVLSTISIPKSYDKVHTLDYQT